MAKSKIPPKPLLALKHDFYESLDGVLGESIMLIQAIEMAVRGGHIKDTVAEVLTERVAAFRKAIFTEEG